MTKLENKTFKRITNNDIYDKLLNLEKKISQQNVHIKVQYGIMSILIIAVYFLFSIIRMGG